MEINEQFLKLSNDDRPFVKVEILGIPRVGLLDSGANRTVLGSGANFLIKACKLTIQPVNIDITTASGQNLEVVGCVELPITFGSVTKIVSALVIPSVKRGLILGSDFWRSFGIVPTITPFKDPISIEELQEPIFETTLTEDQLAKLEEVKQLFKPAVDGQLETTSMINHRIELSEETKKLPPVRINPFPTSPARQDKINQELDSMLKSGIIERSYSDWALRLIPVDKPDGSVRLCLDARKLNERTVRDSYPLPHADRILSRLGPSRYISTIDLSKAFLQVPLHPRSRKYTAFSVLGRGLFQFTRMPFGLMNSPATLARLMDRVLGGSELEPNVFVYLDDIIVISNTFEEHLDRLRDLAARLRAANLSINLQKSKFCVSEVAYLGYILGQTGIRPNPERIEAIVNFERPKSLRAVRRFLGMCNYYRRFIASFSEIVKPLTDLLKDHPKAVKWNEAAESSFVKIKEMLISAPILTNPDFNRPFCIHCDASDSAVAGVLTQKYDEIDRPIAYFSQKLSTTQQRYAATEKEALAVLSSLERFRCYVEGSRFSVITDASALTFILRSNWKISSRLCRWSLQLQKYDMEIIHRKGVDNIVPDALSRSLEEISANSTNSDWYNYMCRKVQEEPEGFKDFRVENGILKKFVSNPDNVDYRFEWKICIPFELREKILFEEHDEAIHLGYEKTLARIRKRYYWPHMTKEVKSYVKKCTICQESKPSNQSQHPIMGRQRVTTKPFQIVAIDYIQSLPRSKLGNCHLLIVMDLFSKYSLLFPVRKISTTSVIKILEENWFRRYGVPECLISDNASTFLSKEFKSLLEKYNIQHWANSRHHSQANPVERLNRTINACIRTYVRENQTLWDSRISEVEHVLNTTPHSSTGFSPYKILFGHEVTGRGDEHRVDRDKVDVSDAERLENKLKIDQSIRDMVVKNLHKQYTKNSQYYNLRRKHVAPVYSVGQKVYKRNFKQSSAIDKFNAKLAPSYIPCMVKARVGTSSYELTDDAGKSLGIFSAADLKPRT